MVRAEPPTPRRPAAPSPVRPTQRPGAGRPPPAPPPAARGICPRAGPPRCRATRAPPRRQGPVWGRASRGSEGRRSAGARPGPAPSSGSAGVSTPRRVGRRPRARALEASPCLLRCPGSSALIVSCGLRAACRRQRVCPLVPPCTSHPPAAARRRGGHVRLGGKSGRARRDPAGGHLGLRPMPRPRPSRIRLPLRTSEASVSAAGRGAWREAASRDHPFLRSHAGFLAAPSLPGSCVLRPGVPSRVPGSAVNIGGEVPALMELTS